MPINTAEMHNANITVLQRLDLEPNSSEIITLFNFHRLELVARGILHSTRGSRTTWDKNVLCTWILHGRFKRVGMCF